jgi:hypothetical protein
MCFHMINHRPYLHQYRSISISYFNEPTNHPNRVRRRCPMLSHAPARRIRPMSPTCRLSISSGRRKRVPDRRLDYACFPRIPRFGGNRCPSSTMGVHTTLVRRNYRHCAYGTHPRPISSSTGVSLLRKTLTGCKPLSSKHSMAIDPFGIPWHTLLPDRIFAPGKS